MRGTLGALADALRETAPAGEVTLVVAGAPDGAGAEELDDEELIERAARAARRGAVDARDAADRWPRSPAARAAKVYRLVVAAGARREDEDGDEDEDEQ